MKVAKLIHSITFYISEYLDNKNGTGKTQLKELRKVKCSIEDITYKDIQQGKRKDLERTLKVHTHYFKEFDTKGMMAKINRENDIYEVINMENVSYKNIEGSRYNVTDYEDELSFTRSGRIWLVRRTENFNSDFEKESMENIKRRISQGCIKADDYIKELCEFPINGELTIVREIDPNRQQR